MTESASQLVQMFCQMFYLHFQEDNGLPVHIKGGTTDVLLYRLTMTITLAGTKPHGQS